MHTKITILAAAFWIAALGALGTECLAQPKKPAHKVCPPQTRFQCAALNIPGSDTCRPFECQAVQKNGLSTWGCVQVNQPAGTQCHSLLACVKVGACGATGGCNPSPESQLICNPTLTATKDGIICNCSNLQCSATFFATGKPFTGQTQMCTKQWLPPFQ